MFHFLYIRVSKVLGHRSHSILSISDKTLYMQHVLFIFCFGGTISIFAVLLFILHKNNEILSKVLLCLVKGVEIL